MSSLSFPPRGGQWVTLALRDLSVQAHLVSHGAHACRSGRLVAIYRAGYRSSPVLVQRADGSQEHAPSTEVSPALVLVDSDGDNLRVPVRTAGKWDVQEATFAPDSPQLQDVLPLDHLADMPPGRVVSLPWAEQMHNQANPAQEHVKLPDHLHQKHPHGLKVAAILTHAQA